MSIKQDRVAGRIREILSLLLLREVADPRLHDVTVTDVKIDTELSDAKIYVDALGDETRRAEVMSGLKRANSYLRREVAHRLQVRSAPMLHFFWDEGLERSERVQRIFHDLVIPPADPHDAEGSEEADIAAVDYDEEEPLD